MLPGLPHFLKFKGMGECMSLVLGAEDRRGRQLPFVPGLVGSTTESYLQLLIYMNIDIFACIPTRLQTCLKISFSCEMIRSIFQGYRAYLSYGDIYTPTYSFVGQKFGGISQTSKP